MGLIPAVETAATTAPSARRLRILVAEDNPFNQQLVEHLLRRNLKLYGAALAIGEEDAVFLVGQLANDAVTEDELDRVLGSLYAWVEQFFRPALRIGFASRFQ